MFYQKVILFFVSLVFISVIYAQDGGSSLADEAQGVVDKIAEVASELQGLLSEAESAGDSTLKNCVSNHLSNVNGLVSSARGTASQIATLVENGKTDEAKNLMEGLNSLVENANQALNQAQSCEGSNKNAKKTTQQMPQQPNSNSANVNNTASNTTVSNTGSDASTSVSDAMSMDIGSDMVTETSRNVEGTDTADAAGAEAGGGIQQSGNETATDEIIPSAAPEDDTQDAFLPVEEEEEIEDQSPTK
jgi:hypothetical protein